METGIMKKHIAIILAIFAAIFFLSGCGSGETEPAERVYLEESEIDAALADGDSFKGKWVVLTGQVFNVDKDGDGVGMQVWYDVDTADRSFIVYATKEAAGDVNEDDYVKVDGEITGVFTGENAFGGEISCMMMEAETVSTGSYDEIIAPAESVTEVGMTQEQHGVSLTIDRIEYAKGEARVYISAKNESGYDASVDTYSAKAVQDGKQFEQEENYDAGTSGDIGELLDGASKEAVMRFKGLEAGKPVKIRIESYSDNYDIEMEDFVFEIE